jgi:hypothetical protein
LSRPWYCLDSCAAQEDNIGRHANTRQAVRIGRLSIGALLGYGRQSIAVTAKSSADSDRLLHP